MSRRLMEPDIYVDSWWIWRGSAGLSFWPNCPGMDRRLSVPRNCYKILPSASWSSENHWWRTVRYFSDFHVPKHWSFQSAHTRGGCCTLLWEQYEAGFWRQEWMKCLGWARGDNELLVDPLASDMGWARRAPLNPAGLFTPVILLTSSCHWMKPKFSVVILFLNCTFSDIRGLCSYLQSMLHIVKCTNVPVNLDWKRPSSPFINALLVCMSFISFKIQNELLPIFLGFGGSKCMR